ncbi:hypothetical protein LSAT2_009253 [Lamellibrachia satsuma]|nr:hypothetical protein LSAT2_009253 [Lamellibrachia satsuma]
MTPDKTTLTWNAEPTLFRGAIENAMKLIPHQRSLPTCSTSACPLVASWEDVKQFYLADCRLSAKLAPKLTSEHIYLPPFSPMRHRCFPTQYMQG